MSLRINNNSIAQMKINGANIGLAKINGSIVFQLNNATITLTIEDKKISAISDKNGSFDFYYANNNGILEDYDKIVSFNLKANVKSTYTHLNTLNIAPYQANKIVVCKRGTKTIISSSSLPSQFLFDNSSYGSKLYSVGLLSDTHIDGDGTDESYSMDDLKKALQYFNDDENVAFTIINGDVTYDNRTNDYVEFQKIKNNYSANTPLKVIAGNHDDYSTLQTYSGCSLYYEYTHNNDIYLFVGMSNGSSTNPFSTEELTWLQNKLEEHKSKRIFLFFHIGIEPVGLINELDNGFLGTTGQSATFRQLMTTYKNVIYFSGHTHLTYALQKFGADANIKTNDEMCYRVHIPSCGRPRLNDSGTSIDETYNNLIGSEGAILDVYDNGIVIKGRDFAKDKFLPIAMYGMLTKIEQAGGGTYTLASSWVKYNNANSDGKLTQGNLDVWMYGSGGGTTLKGIAIDFTIDGTLTLNASIDFNSYAGAPRYFGVYIFKDGALFKEFSQQFDTSGTKFTATISQEVTTGSYQLVVGSYNNFEFGASNDIITFN